MRMFWIGQTDDHFYHNPIAYICISACILNRNNLKIYISFFFSYFLLFVFNYFYGTGRKLKNIVGVHMLKPDIFKKTYRLL